MLKHLGPHNEAHSRENGVDKKGAKRKTTEIWNFSMAILLLHVHSAYKKKH